MKMYREYFILFLKKQFEFIINGVYRKGSHIFLLIVTNEIRNVIQIIQVFCFINTIENRKYHRKT